MDAARAAAMSDPAQNHHFRRRWQDDTWPQPPPANPPVPSNDPDLTGLALLQQWRRERAMQQGGR